MPKAALVVRIFLWVKASPIRNGLTRGETEKYFLMAPYGMGRTHLKVKSPLS